MWLDGLFAVIDDLELLGLKFQEHRSQPWLPRRLESYVGDVGAGLEVASQAELLKLDPKRAVVLDERLHLLRRHVRRCRHRGTRHDADRSVAGPERDRDLGQPRNLIEGLEKRLVAQVELECGVGDLTAILLTQVRDRVAGLLLKLLQCLAEPDSLAGDRDLARANVDLVLFLGQRSGCVRAVPCAGHS